MEELCAFLLNKTFSLLRTRFMNCSIPALHISAWYFIMTPECKNIIVPSPKCTLKREKCSTLTSYSRQHVVRLLLIKVIRHQLPVSRDSDVFISSTHSLNNITEQFFGTTLVVFTDISHLLSTKPRLSSLTARGLLCALQALK